jgi:putative RNA 2'-phosphotransferase
VKPIYRCRVCGCFTEERSHCGVPAELLLDGRSRERLSKLMSGLLRHFPEAGGLRLDPQGFVGIEELAEALRRLGHQWVGEEHVRAVAELDPKGRFEVAGSAIRARYGHSIPVRIRYEVEYPAQPLYHGTSRSRLDSILSVGLLPMKRLYVHLTTSLEDALERARRFPDPVVLAVDPLCLKKRGLRVFKGGKNVYLVRRVPPDCLKPLEHV